MIPKEQNLMDNLGKISYTLDKAYLSKLENDYCVLPFDEYYNKEQEISYVSNIRTLRVKRCVIDKEEKVVDCFKNILSLFSDSEKTLALVLKRTPKYVEMYFVVKNVGLGCNEDSKANIELLAESIRGNLPGTEIEVINEKNGGNDTAQIFDLSNMEAVSVLSNIPSEKSENFASQGMEKLLNGIVPQSEADSYTVAFVGEAIPLKDIRNIIKGYEEIATAITPFASYQFQAGLSKTETQGEMDSLSHSEGISHSITKTHSVNVSSSKFRSLSAGMNLGIFNVGVADGGASSAGYGYSWGTTDTENKMDTETTGTNRSMSIGTSENTTYTYKSYLVSDLISKLETVIKRIDESKSSGLWKYATYVFSSNTKTTVNVANFLRSISQGDSSHIEPSFIQTWINESSNGVTTFSEIQKYVKHFTHPVFGNRKDGTLVTPTSDVATSELANILSFPRHSINALPVIECVRFGREPHSLNKLVGDIDIGCSYHMHQKEINNLVFLNMKELTKHTFITGSTGSGKSNTIYTLLNNLSQNQVKFMVIEPAKGEYKQVFGGRKDVTVYGTNPKKSELLRINPFSFPDDIHVLEHIDRLVEIFNACWPMYAAMPAVLKDAVEQAYIKRGWSLTTSTNVSGVFPTFRDLLTELPLVMEQSAYSKDTKGDYIGALVTRVKSLTNGINGQVFCGLNELPNETLFDENIIVDLSRVGSSETKSLIMGLMVMKLQEYRMCQSDMNSDLKHVTVLEEAHNLLRRTSSEQSQEGSNLQGKSVEMLANAIAEMRTYGEGFIIADQSPGLLDLSVIRNTNTKILMRLPDQSDRELVGKSIGLNDSQIMELSKLEVGVAAVYQSDWLEAVLCKINHFSNSCGYEYHAPSQSVPNSARETLLSHLVSPEENPLDLSPEQVDSLKQWIGWTSWGSKPKNQLLRLLKEGTVLDKDQCGELLYQIAQGKSLCEQANEISPEEKLPLFMELEIVERLQVSHPLAEQIRQYVCDYVVRSFPGVNTLVEKIRRTGGVS